MARQGQAAAMNTAAGSHEPVATVKGAAANKRRTTYRCDRARSDRNASIVDDRPPTASESASTHSGAVTHSPASVGHSANVAAPNVAHPGSMAALCESGIGDEDHNCQNCETCDQQLLHSRFHSTRHIGINFKRHPHVRYDLDQSEQGRCRLRVHARFDFKEAIARDAFPMCPIGGRRVVACAAIWLMKRPAATYHPEPRE